MKRSMILSAGCLLIASPVLATTLGYHSRASHEIARFAQSTLLICEQDRASVVALDRKCFPMRYASAECEHCSDGSLVSVVGLAKMVVIERGSEPARPNTRAATEIIPVSGLAVKPPREFTFEFRF